MTTAQCLRWISIGLGGAICSLALRGADQLINKPFTEDGFYALAIARNVGTGQGVTIDGSVWTNGFQPLWVFVAAPIYAATGGATVWSLYGVLLLHVIFLILTAWLLGRFVADLFELPLATPPSRHGDRTAAPILDQHNRAASRQPDPVSRAEPGAMGRSSVLDVEALRWGVTALYLASLFILEQHLNGLETGLYLFILVLVARQYQAGAPTTIGGCVRVGALLGALVLARVDSVFLVIILAAAELMRSDRQVFGRGLARAAALSSVAFLVSLPWWAYNYFVFGSPLPISGTAQQWWSFDPAVLSLRVGRAYHALVQVLIPWLPTLHLARLDTSIANLARPALIVLSILVALRVWRRWPPAAGDSVTGRRDAYKKFGLEEQQTLKFATCFATWCAVLVGWYVLSSGASHFYERYWAPLMLLSVCGWSIAAFCSLPRRLILGITVILVVAQTAAIVAMHAGMVFRGNEFYRNQLALVREHIPDGVVVAAAQTGTLGYFRRHVINLDGKVNPDTLRIRERARAYLDAQNVDWFVDWQYNVSRFLGQVPGENGWELVDARERFELYRRVE